MESYHNYNQHWHHTNNGYYQNNVNDDYEEWFEVVTRVIYTLWLTAYIIPNVILIVAFVKRSFYQQNFYFIMVHWSIANLLQMIFPIYVLYVPTRNLDRTTITTFLAMHCAASGALLSIATHLIFDKFMNDKKFCTRTITINWIGTLLSMVISVALGISEAIHIYLVALIYEVLSAVYFLVYVGRMFRFLCKGSQEAYYCVRLCLSGILTFSNVIFCIWLILDISADGDFPALLIASLCVTLSNGVINMVVLYLYHPEAKARIKELGGNIRCCCRRVPSAVIETSNPTTKTSEENDDTPPNYEEAIQKQAVYEDMYQHAPAYEEVRRNNQTNGSSV